MGEYIHIQYLAFSAERNKKQEPTTAKSAPSTQILAIDMFSNKQKQKPGLLREMVDSRSRAGNIGGELGASYCARKSVKSKQTSQPYNDGVMSKGHDALNKIPNGQSWNNYNKGLLAYSSNYKINI